VLGVWAAHAAALFSTVINILPANELGDLANNQQLFYFSNQIHAHLPDRDAFLPLTRAK
jgi:hypothetical protein